MSLLLTYFNNKAQLILHMLLVGACLLLGILSVALPIQKALFILAALTGCILIFLSITNYRLGYAIAMGAGFSIFIVSRFFMDIFPVGWIVEVFVYSSFLGLLGHCLVNKVSLFQGLKHWITAAFLFYLLFLIWEAFNPQMTSLLGWFNFFRRQLMVFILLVLTCHVINSEKDIKYVLKLWFFFSVLAALYAIVTQHIALPAFENEWVMASKTRQNLYYLVDGFKRKYSLYSDPAAFGMDMAATVLIFVVLYLFEPTTNRKLFYVLLITICLFGAVYSGTRTAYLMIFSGIFLYLLIRGINRNTLLVGFGTAALIFGIIFAPIYNNLFLNRLKSAFYFKQDASLQIRNINREKIQPYIYEYPIGGGVYTSGGQGMEFNPDHFLAGFPPDSGYLRAALETGWIGLLVVLAFHFIILRSGIYAYFQITEQGLKKAVMASTITFFSFVIANYGQEPFGQLPSCFLFCIACAIIIKSLKISNNSVS